MNLPPILFLVFNRPDTTALVMEAIRRARPSRLYVAADGPRDRPGEAERCAKARSIAAAVDWPCQVRTLFRDHNLGCHEAVGGAISWFFAQEEEGIILEDDCLPSADFFPYCAELLERFRADARVMAICGSCYAVSPQPSVPASYSFAYYADMWGWATWRRAWQLYDHELSRWPRFKANRGLDALAAGRSWHESYWTDRFDSCLDGRTDSWGYRWIYSVIEQNGLVCYPVRNLVSNLGYRSDATHTVMSGPIPVGSPANLPHQRLEFPLRHPTEVVRSAALEEQIEAVRILNLKPPVAAQRSVSESVRTRLTSVAERLFGEEAGGMIDYYRHPETGLAWGGPFNGQDYRVQLFKAIVGCIRPTAIIETGAFLGTTTALMVETGLPVFALEGQKRNYGFARARLRKRHNLSLRLGDSRAALSSLIDGALHSAENRTIFAYLDARWNEVLPIATELDIIFSRCPAAVVMIDDFQVPDDPGYGYDDDGKGQELTLTGISQVVVKHGLCAFYPLAKSFDETGARRGCAVLAKDGLQARTLASCSSLRTLDESRAHSMNVGLQAIKAGITQASSSRIAQNQ
jgi:hypothetical protein